MTVPSLQIISEQFMKWSENYQQVTSFLKESKESSSFAKLYYYQGSAHISQSDFHLLFPYVTRRFFHSKADAFKIMELNVRAGIEFLRSVGVGVKAEKDVIFEEIIEGWVELTGDIEVK